MEFYDQLLASIVCCMKLPKDSYIYTVSCAVW